MKNQAKHVFYVNYQPRLMIVRTATMTRLAELAHRRLCDWIWAEGHAPVNDARALASITRCEPNAWKDLRAELGRNGWVGVRHRFTHPEAMDTLRLARLAARLAASTGRLGASRRWGKPIPITPARPARRTKPAVAKPPIGPHKAPTRKTIGAHKAPNGGPIALTNKELQITNKELQITNKESFKRLTAERLTLSSSPPEEPHGEENQFLANLAQTLSAFNPKQSSTELTNWGGWWRLRFREDPAKARRVLAELGSMIREQRVRTNAGAAAKDLWERFA